MQVFLIFATAAALLTAQVTIAVDPELSNVFGTDPVPTFHLDRRGQIRAMSGSIREDDSDENEEDPQAQVPWRHHVNFDEFHPGEDQIAVESHLPFAGDDDEIQESSEGHYLGVRNSMRRMMEFFSQMANKGDTPWWKGKNVCIRREEEDRAVAQDAESDAEEDELNYPRVSDLSGFHLRLASCEDKEMKHTCVTHLIGPNINRTIRTDYECCTGYILSRSRKCERGTLKSIASTVSEVGGVKFSELVQRSGLSSKLESENLTLFVPSDGAVDDFLRGRLNAPSNSIDQEVERRRRSIFESPTATRGRQTRRSRPFTVDNSIDDTDWRLETLEQQENWNTADAVTNEVTYTTNTNDPNALQQRLLNHMTTGKITTDDFVDEKVLYSESADKGVLRLNTWNVGNKKMNTVNCAKLISTNHQCSNGMVHVVDRMFSPVTSTIADVVSTDPRLSDLWDLLRTSGHFTKLQDVKEHITLFAPTNAALMKLGPAMLHKLRNGDPCLQRIMDNHILPFTLCSSIIYEKVQTRNAAQGILDVERTTDDKLFVNGSQIITKDIVTTNGVLHIIDAVLLSPSDKPIWSSLQRAGLTAFAQLLIQAGLQTYMDEVNKVTVFAPSNEAIEKLPDDTKLNPTRLREVLMYHIGKEETRACDFTNGQSLQTKFNDLPIRIDLYTMFPFLEGGEITAQCGRLTKLNTPACNGVIHTVDRVLIPAQRDVLQVLKTQQDLSIFTRLLKATNYTESLKGSAGFWTVFAPTDAAFYALPREHLQAILNDNVKALRVLQNHIIAESLCCSGVPPNNWLMMKRVKTMSKLLVAVHRDVNGQVVFGNSKVGVCDLTASNGVIHTVNSLLEGERDWTNAEEFMGSCLPKVKDIHSTMFLGF